jgi:two-component system phosphate regulon sensor histidine kinase PhoR
MQRRRLFWQIFPALLAMTLASLACVTWLVTTMLQGFYNDRAQNDLLARARLIQGDVERLLIAGDAPGLDRLAKTLGKASGTRVTVIAPNGRVLGESDLDPATMENHARRPEVIQALREGVGTIIRPSDTEKADLVYVAVPVERDGKALGVLRVAFPLTAVQHQLQFCLNRIMASGALIAVLAAVLSLWISLRLARPLEQLRARAAKFAQGDLDAPLPETTTEEISELAQAMKNMAQELHRRFRNEVRQRNEQQAVLSSMVEGVLAIDSQERVLNVNAAGARLLGLTPAEAQGRSIQEAVRNRDLQLFIRRALASVEPVEGDVTIYGDEQRHLRANGSVLHDAEGLAIGAVVVLHDVTRLRMLEQMRRDFVANVSHELRTPITSIKGFAETLLEAEGHDEEARRFLGIIARQADRLNAIIEDLLALARIEQDAEHDDIARAKGSIREILAGAIQICARKAEEKGVRVVLECDEPIQAELNAPLVEQAVVNLLDNAIKYSEPGAEVRVVGALEEGQARVHVIDQGCGIEPRHQARVFERFYRVDKARSRKLGGTGLGLAIVKHIAEAHKGSVAVQSVPGTGSTFTLSLPAAPAEGSSSIAR